MNLNLRSLAHIGAQMDSSVMRQDDSLDDGEAKAGSVLLMSYKGTINILHMFGRNTAAVVLDGNHQLLVVRENLQGNTPMSGYGFHGVFDQIQEDLLQPYGIGIKVRIGIIQLDEQRDMPFDQF